MPKRKAGTILPTDQEDAVITRQAEKDGTLLDDTKLAEMKPLAAFPELHALVKPSVEGRRRAGRSSQPRCGSVLRCWNFSRLEARADRAGLMLC